MKTTTMKMALGSLAVCFAFGAFAAEPEIRDVMVRQRWPWSRLVDIDYVLTSADQQVDITVTGFNGTTPLTLPYASLTGDRYSQSSGAHRIVWDPMATAYTNEGVLGKFRVSLTPTLSPLYMVVDLTMDAGAQGQITYVSEEDLTNGLWGAWVRNPVTNNGTVVESVVWTGVTTNDIYKTDKLVLRRVPAGSFQMGDTQTGTPNVTLTKGMYAGVFEVTQKQWNLVMGTTGGTDAQAKQNVSYYQIREDPAGAEGADDPAVDWPSNKAVNAASFMGRLRAKTGIPDFDLPTAAQWEYLCRAKTTTVFNDGNADAKYTGTEEDNNGDTNGYLNVLGWYKFSAPTPPTAAMPVGGKWPNAWGLYDTHGNVWEWCLDLWDGTFETGTDPDGPSTGTNRTFRGGGWGSVASKCLPTTRNGVSPTYKYDGSIGFRVVRTLP